jgi:hypothetical protein
MGWDGMECGRQGTSIISSISIDHLLPLPSIQTLSSPVMATSATLPPTPNVQDVNALDNTLSLLLEPSPALHNLLVPAIHSRISSTTSNPTTYSDLIDLCAEEIKSWDMEDKAVFLGGHPLIGEVKGLSALSNSEQGGPVRTPEVVLKR